MAFETIFNFIKEKYNYIIDIKTLNEIIYKNKSKEDITSWLKYLSLKLNESKFINSEVLKYILEMVEYVNYLKDIIDLFKKFAEAKKIIKIKFENIKQRKEFFCLLSILDIIQHNDNYKFIEYEYEEKDEKNKKEEKKKKKVNILNPDKIKKKIENYFIKEKNENNEEICSIFNYYYTSNKEKEIFGDNGKEKKSINYEGFIFDIEYKYNTTKQWDIIYE